MTRRTTDHPQRPLVPPQPGWSGPMRPLAPPPSPRGPRRWSMVVLVIVAAIVVGSGAAVTNAFGLRDRMDHLVARVDLALHPPADRTLPPAVAETVAPDEIPDDANTAVDPDPSGAVELTPEPDGIGAADDPSAAASRSAGPRRTPRPDRTARPTPRPTPTPRPVRRPVKLRLKVADPGTTFASQVEDTMCAPAGLQIVLAMHDHAGTSSTFQRKLHARLDEWESRADAKAGGWGPAAMTEALAAYGVRGYKVHLYDNRNQALRDAAVAMTRTGAPAIIIAWRGAHTWVMTGYTADADPTVFSDARITGIAIFDPWYPRVSSIWGPSDPPGTIQDLAEIKRNYLPWHRPEGSYPGRDGKYITVIPTIPLKEQLGAAAR